MLRYLRALVTGLAVVMGLGIIAIVAILWLRLGAVTPLPVLPENITLPAGTSAAAVTFARDWIVVVSDTGEVFLFDRAGQLKDQIRP